MVIPSSVHSDLLPLYLFFNQSPKKNDIPILLPNPDK